MKRIYFFFIYLILLSIQVCFAGDFRYLRTNEGLYNGEINSITQDKSGKMWFATWSGLTSHNGYDFQFFLPQLGDPHSLPDKKVNKIFVDSKDNLWIATLAGVCIFRKETQTYHPVSVSSLSSVNLFVFGFYESKGHVLIHTNAGIFLAYFRDNSDPKIYTKRLSLFSGNAAIGDYIHYMNTFNDQLVLVSNADAYNPHRVFLSDLVFNGKDTVLNIRDRTISPIGINASVYEKDANCLYLATTGGISILSLSQNSVSAPEYFKGQNIQNLYLASDQKIYAYSTNPALLFVDLKTGQTGRYLPDPLVEGSLLDNNIMCLFEDFSGNLWVGHQGLGLSILNLNRKAFNTFKREPANSKSINGNIVMCFNGTDDVIFVGLRQGGINITSKKLAKDGKSDFGLLTYRQNSEANSIFDHIWDITRESDSVFWVGSDGGLVRLKKTDNGWMYGSRNEEPLYEGVVRKVLIDKNRNIWCGTLNNGLRYFPAIKNNPERKSYAFLSDQENGESISDNTVLSMQIDSKNRFWIGTNKGLNLLKTTYSSLDLSGKTIPDMRFRRFVATIPQKDFLTANEINCIFENKDGKIWVATQGGGINILNVDSLKFSHINTENGLSGNDVLGILADQSGKKWISTNKGIMTIEAENKTKPYSYFSSIDGLQGETYKVNSYFQSVDGELFFGGDNGFTRFYPDQIKFNPTPPRIGLTVLRIMNKVINVGDTISRGIIMAQSLDQTDKIELPYSKNSFSIGVGVHHYQHPGRNLIRYKLDGYNDRWITISAANQNVYCTKLPYGKYTLHITAVSSDNVEAKSERTLEIRILPPWYQTWYTRTIVSVMLIFLLGYLLYWISSRQRASFQKKIDAISFENNENKMRFLTNIAHELRTPLSLVIAPIEDMQLNYTTIDPKWKNHLRLIYRNSNYLLTLINQIIDFRKLNAGKLQLNLQITDISMLVREVVANFKGLESARKTNLHLQVSDQAILVEIDSQKIEEVLYNLLSNAFKHTSENHSIEVSLELLNSANGKNQVRITVFNEGKDISDEDKVKIFERFYKVSEKVEGAGIGLSFSKSLIEMHNGNITVESVEGKGVAFHVDLPFDQIEICDTVTDMGRTGGLWHEGVYNSEQVHELENNGKSLTIVIVEDNIDLRTFLKSTLSEGFNCYEAGDGKEGYEIITKILPDIVISDVIMPKMDGYELCEKIKENSKTCHIPIILLTAINTSDHVVAGYEKGADAYVTKPFDMSIIRAQISRLIKNRELIREKYVKQNFMVEVTNTNLSKDDEFIIKLRHLLEENLSVSAFNVKKLSEDLNISTTHLYRKLKALTGLSPVEFIRMFKLQKACEMLSNTSYSVKEIGYGLGFNNLSYFVKCFREQFGITPTSYRQKGMPDPIKIVNTNQSGMS